MSADYPYCPLENQLVLDPPLRKQFPHACNVYRCMKCDEECSADAQCISDCCNAPAWLAEW